MAIPRNLSDLANQVDSSGTLGVAGGGTGLTAVGTTGQVLSSNGTSLAWVTPAGGAESYVIQYNDNVTLLNAGSNAGFGII